MTVKVSKPAINVREELADLRKPTGVAGEAMLRAETPQEQFNLIGAGRRNLIINGAMNVSQRGDYTSATSTVDGTYRVDRWQAETFGPTINFQHITTNQPSGFPNSKSIKAITTSTGSGNIGHQQKVEDYKLFSYQTFTISAWVKTNRSDVRLSYYDGSTTYGQKTAVGNGEWQYMSETFVNNRTSSQFVLFIKSVAADGSVVSFSTGDYVEITGVQLELGKVATPFEHRSYGEELALCQRYYQNSFDAGEAPTHNSLNAVYRYIRPYSGTNLAGLDVSFPVPMRATPSCTLWTTNPSSSLTTGRITYFNGTSWTNDVAGMHESTSSKRISVSTTVAPSTTELVQFNFEADAEL